MSDAIMISNSDNVAVALHDLKQGDFISVGGQNLYVRENIPHGYKVALSSLRKGEPVVKYGFTIGCASETIQAGSKVHTHNMETSLSGEKSFSYYPELQIPSTKRDSFFQGFLRSDGKCGIRNEIWILPLVGCVNDVARKLAEENQNLVKGTVDGIFAFTHPFGCSQTGDDHQNTKRFLASLASHPNAGAVLIIGLGCENLTMEQFKEELGDYDSERIQFLVCQECEDELKEGGLLLQQCASYASKFSRQALSVSNLIFGMKCGGSDGLSGVTANPAVGRVSDLLVSSGGTSILTEVPEMFGAEEMLLSRCINQEVFQKAVTMINDFKKYFLQHGEKISENPSPGNKAGGITTLEDKSCGCVQKGGTMPIADVLDYGCMAEKKGLNLLCGPGNDLVSASALAAAGAQLILFTTGRGTPFGSPVPTLKVATNTQIAKRKTCWIDFDASSVAEGESLDSAAERLFHLALEVSNGRKTQSEMNGYREISIWKNGVTL